MIWVVLGGFVVGFSAASGCYFALVAFICVGLFSFVDSGLLTLGFCFNRLLV